MEVRFYHLVKSSIHQALPALLEKSLARGWWAGVYTNENLSELSHALWTERPNSFLAHGIKNQDEDKRDDCPIWLTNDLNDLPKTHVTFLINPQELPKITPPLLALLFDEKGIEKARQFWLEVKEKADKVTYWQQRDDGHWIEKTGN